MSSSGAFRAHRLAWKELGSHQLSTVSRCFRLESTYCRGCLMFLRVRILLGTYSGEFSALLTSSPSEISSKLQPGRFSLDGNFLSISQFSRQARTILSFSDSQIVEQSGESGDGWSGSLTLKVSRAVSPRPPLPWCWSWNSRLLSRTRQHLRIRIVPARLIFVAARGGLPGLFSLFSAFRSLVGRVDDRFRPVLLYRSQCQGSCASLSWKVVPDAMWEAKNAKL